MPVTSSRQPVWNEGAARGLICLIAFGFGPSVIKVAHPWYTTICETGSLINTCDVHPDDRRATRGGANTPPENFKTFLSNLTFAETFKE